MAQWIIILVTLAEGLKSAPVPSVGGSSLLVTLVPTGSVNSFLASADNALIPTQTDKHIEAHI